MTDHPTGTREEHRQARLRLLEAEKEHTRRGDELADLFDGRSQLLDRAPRGRDEDALPVPVAWVRRHDEYGQAEPAPAG